MSARNSLTMHPSYDQMITISAFFYDKLWNTDNRTGNESTMSRHLTMAELEAGLAELGTSPQDSGTLEMIVCRPGVNERRVLEQAELHPINGLIGDSWRVRGSKSTEDGRAHPDSQIA